MSLSEIPNSAAPARVGIVISMFPELHETFILRELTALERKGADFQIYSLQLPRDPITLPDAKRLSTERTVYSRLFSLRPLSSFAKTCVRHPVRMMRALAKLVANSYDRPMDIVKALAILPVTLYFGEHAKKRGISHLHGHWANIPTTACWFLQEIQGFTWSAAIHGEDIFSSNRFLPYKLDCADFTVVCSGYFCKHLKENIGLSDPARVHLNYHGLDPAVMQLSAERSFKKRAPDEPFTIVVIGRLVPTKGHDIVFQACARLNDLLTGENAGYRLKLIGSGPEEQQLKVLAESLGLQENIEFIGGLAFGEVLDTLCTADAFCLAPRMVEGYPPDGIPNVIAEAMALRIPVVTTRFGAIPELVESGDSGLLVEVDDDEAFATAVAKIANDQTFANELSDQGFNKVERLFDQEANINDLLSLFEQYTGRSLLDTVDEPSNDTAIEQDSDGHRGRHAA